MEWWNIYCRELIIFIWLLLTYNVRGNYTFVHLYCWPLDNLILRIKFCTCSKRKLVPWLRLILRNQTVIETMYQPWSYTVATGSNVSLLWGNQVPVAVEVPISYKIFQLTSQMSYGSSARGGWCPLKIAGDFPKIVSILALRVTSIFIGFTIRFFLLSPTASVPILCNKIR